MSEAPLRSPSLREARISAQAAASAQASSAAAESMAEKASGALTYAASLREGDDIVRRILAAVDAAGLADNTLTVVTSDHGPAKDQVALYSRVALPSVIHLRFEHRRHAVALRCAQDTLGGATGPFRGGKFTELEGGLRVFAVVHWPRLLGTHAHVHGRGLDPSGAGADPTGRDAVAGEEAAWRVERRRLTLSGDALGVTSGAVVSSLDLFPTFAAVARVSRTTAALSGSKQSSILARLVAFVWLSHHQNMRVVQAPLRPDRQLDGRDVSALLVAAGHFRARHRQATLATTDTAAVSASTSGPAAGARVGEAAARRRRIGAGHGDAGGVGDEAGGSAALAEAERLQDRVLFFPRAGRREDKEPNGFAAMRIGRYKVWKKRREDKGAWTAHD